MRLAAHWRAMAASRPCSRWQSQAAAATTTTASEKPAHEHRRPQEAKKGGDLSVLYAGDVDNIDPGITYYQYGFLVAYATQRPLYSFKPDDAINPEPDLAEGAPEISDDGKTLTIKIRTGVKFSPPVNREVTTKDVKYAIERALHQEGQRPVRGRVHERHRGRQGVPGRQGGRDLRHHDAGRSDDRLQAEPPARGDRRRRARAAGLGAGAEGVRGEVRQREGHVASTATTRSSPART